MPVPPVFAFVFGEQLGDVLDDELLMVPHVPFAQSHFVLNVSSEDSVPMLKMISMIEITSEQMRILIMPIIKY